MNITLESGNGLGSAPGAELIIDKLRGAARVGISPLDYADAAGSLLGHYRANLISGTTVSLAAAAPIGSFRWSDGHSFAVPMRITASANVNAAITTGTVVDLEAVIARSFTASDSSGSPVTASKLRSVMGNSIVSDLRIATTSALTPGTRTLDAAGFGFATFALGLAVSGANSAGGPVDLYKWDALGQHPIVLAANEGIVFRVPTAGPTTGGIRYAITVEWAEVAFF